MRAPECASLTVLEMGAIWFLVDAYWQSQGVPMPNDEASLSALARCHTRRWHDIRARVMPAWQRLQPRLARVYAKAAPIAAVRIANAKRATEVSALNHARRKAAKQADSFVDAANTGAALVSARRNTATQRVVSNENASAKPSYMLDAI